MSTKPANPKSNNKSNSTTSVLQTITKSAKSNVKSNNNNNNATKPNKSNDNKNANDSSSSSDEESSDAEIAIDLHTEASKKSLTQAKLLAQQKKQQLQQKGKSNKNTNNNSNKNNNKRKAEINTNDDNSNSDSDSSVSSDDDLINISFELNDMTSNDYHIIKSLLKDYVDDENINISQLSDIISQQVNIGTTIKADGTDEPLGFITALNIKQYTTNNHNNNNNSNNGDNDSKSVVNDICNYLLKKASHNSDKSIHKRLSSIINSGNSNLLISHRVINTPQTIIPHLHDALIKDIEWDISSNNNTANTYKDFIILCRCFQADYAAKLSNNSDQSSKKKQKKTSNTNTNDNNMDNLLFYRFEEEYYLEYSDFSFKFPLNFSRKSSEDERKKDIPQSIVACVIKFENMKKIRDLLIKLLQTELK